MQYRLLELPRENSRPEITNRKGGENVRANSSLKACSTNPGNRLPFWDIIAGNVASANFGPGYTGASFQQTTIHMENKIKIESDVPLPAKSKKYPFSEMNIGDSFFVPTEHSTPIIALAASQSGKRLGRKFMSRKVEGGYRCWRLE